jgi:hypothetical protein
MSIQESIVITAVAAPSGLPVGEWPIIELLTPTSTAKIAVTMRYLHEHTRRQLLDLLVDKQM